MLMLNIIKLINNRLINNSNKLGIIHYYIQRNEFGTSSNHQKSFTNWYKSLWMPNSNDPPFEHITQIGDPVLRQKSPPVPEAEIKSKEVKYLVNIMKNVLRKHDCVGLAAPQIGINLRIIIMEFSESLKDEFTIEEYRNRQMATLPLTVFINPQLKITNYNKTTTFYEACASVIGYTGTVQRYEECELSGYDENGNPNKLVLTGWNARIAQHEMDHINGIVYTDLMDRKTFKCTSWEAVNAHCGKLNIPFIPKKKKKYT